MVPVKDPFMRREISLGEVLHCNREGLPKAFLNPEHSHFESPFPPFLLVTFTPLLGIGNVGRDHNLSRCDARKQYSMDARPTEQR
jgi:hypothetical protein